MDKWANLRLPQRGRLRLAGVSVGDRLNLAEDAVLGACGECAMDAPHPPLRQWWTSHCACKALVDHFLPHTHSRVPGWILMDPRPTAHFQDHTHSG